MSVSRSGYYKWKYRKLNPSIKELSRQADIRLIKEVHNAHPSHGYRWINAFIRNKYGIEKSKVLFAHFGAMNSNKGTIEFLNSLALLPDSIINLSHFFLAVKVDEGIKDDFYTIYNQIKE